MENDLPHPIRRRVHRRFLFCAAVWIPYAAFVLQYAGLREFFARPLAGGSLFTVAMLFFCALIVGFLLLEFVYLRSREREDAHGER